jgi:hypothetical protein
MGLDTLSDLLSSFIPDFSYQMCVFPCFFAALVILSFGLLEAVFGLKSPRYGLLVFGMGFLASFVICFLIC